MAIAAANMLLSLAALAAEEIPVHRIEVAHSLVRLGDLMETSSLPQPMRDRAARIEIVRVHAASLIVTRSFLLQRIRSQAPQLAEWSENHVRRSFAVSYRPLAPRAHVTCLRALNDVEEGDVLRSEDFALSDCEKVPQERFFRYRPAERAVRSRRPILAGTILPRFAGYGVVHAYAGDRMTLIASVGHVRIERQAHALQSARQDERIFVRTDDGDVLSVPYAGAAQ